MAQTVKNLPAMQETWVRSLGWDDPLEKEMATHSSIPAWRIPWTEEPGGLQSGSHKKSDTTITFTFYSQWSREGSKAQGMPIRHWNGVALLAKFSYFFKNNSFIYLAA